MTRFRNALTLVASLSGGVAFLVVELAPKLRFG
jgi:hypothetical protein